MPAMSDDLVARLVEASELHGDFVLSSGKRSSVYFDKFLFLTRPDLLRELAHAVAGVLPDGVEGHAPPGARACLIEDVSTTGHQVRRAAEVLAAAGVSIERIVLAIDRGGADHLREAGYDVAAVAVLRPPEEPGA
jgi:orotate phosphoribosyltransferase